jgi:hypothetical protein
MRAQLIYHLSSFSPNTINLYLRSESAGDNKTMTEARKSDTTILSLKSKKEMMGKRVPLNETPIYIIIE